MSEEFKKLSLSNGHTLFESLEEKKEKGGFDVISLKEITAKVGYEEIGNNIIARSSSEAGTKCR